MINTLVLVALGELLIFAIGVLTGSDYTTREQDRRGRHQAERHRELRAWTRELEKKATRLTARENDLRQRYLEQAGFLPHDFGQSPEPPHELEDPPAS